jgi:hypothetical protein
MEVAALHTHERIYQRRRLDEYFDARACREKLYHSLPLLSIGAGDLRAEAKGVYVLSQRIPVRLVLSIMCVSDTLRICAFSSPISKKIQNTLPDRDIESSFHKLPVGIFRGVQLQQEGPYLSNLVEHLYLFVVVH